jgi:EAL domain-containing protein (putative c-di-GMP-specific phosphodiesterase class I)
VTDGRVPPDEALRCADQAMYDKKHARLRRRDVVLGAGEDGADLQRGLDAGELRVLYQPFYDVCRAGRGLRGHLSGAEALVRWQHPTRGLLGADQVVPLAEQTGLVGELGRQVLAQAVAQTAEWDRRGLLPPDFRTHVNLAAQQLHTGRVLDTVVELLADSGLSPGRLCVEVTESGMLDVEEFTVAAARAISALGVELALDDFGTGFSSLTQLRSYPFGVVKVDRSFVRGLGTSCEDEAIVESVVALALRLGVVPVAEGVETLEQLHRLVDLGCIRVQGFLLGRPAPGADWDEAVLLTQDLMLGADPTSATCRSDEDASRGAWAACGGSPRRAERRRLDP